MKTMKKLLVLLLTCLLTTGCMGQPTPEDALPVPILLYHHFTATPPPKSAKNTEACSLGQFQTHMTALHEAGYQTITFADLLAYGEEGTPLPEKPVLVLSADGANSALSTYTTLQACDYTMSIAIIGSRLTSMYGLDMEEWEKMAAMDNRYELVSHTWDLHNEEDKLGILVSDGSLSPSLAKDTALMQAMEALNQTVFVYPFGSYNDESEKALAEMGYRITVTTEEGIARLSPGDAEGLMGLPCVLVNEWMEAEELLSILKKS